MTPTNITDLARIAIDRLSEELFNSGCNDLTVKNTPEMRRLWDEREAENLGVSVDLVRDHEDYWDKFANVTEGSNVVVNDSLLLFALRKLTGAP